MGNSDSKLADRNAAIKLIFPSHGLPFVIPFSVLPELVTKIDEILKDMEKKNPTPRESWKLKLPSGKVLDPPSAGDWVLVDIANSQLIHNSVLNIQVVAGGTYLVLPMRGSDISEADLKEAVKVVKATRTGEDVPPVYTSGESGRG